MNNTTAVPVRRLGVAGPEVFPISLGCMAMSGIYGPSDENECVATIHEALERGVNLIDTGDFYGMGHNEMLIARALKGRREKALISLKFGAQRGPDGSWLGFDGRAASVKNFLAHSLTRLGTDHVDVYRPARLDATVPIEETIGAIADMIKAGYVRFIGLSEMGPETIRRAAKVHPIADLQIEYSLISRGPEKSIFPALKEMGIAATVYGVLSRGLLTGAKASDAKGDMRKHFPRFVGENRERNQKLIDALSKMAKEKGISAARLATAWVLAKGEHIIPVMGSRTRAQLNDALGALDVRLSAEEVAELERAIPAEDVAGTRYAEVQMRQLDSEVG
jgi:aryl-alcohol dehydrogenase-like predicted oxidoreductase